MKICPVAVANVTQGKSSNRVNSQQSTERFYHIRVCLLCQNQRSSKSEEARSKSVNVAMTLISGKQSAYFASSSDISLV